MRTSTLPSAFRLTSALALSIVLGTTLGCHRDPNKVKLKYLQSGERYANEGKYKEASIQFANALKVDHNYGDAHYQLAKVYLKEGSYIPAYAELLRTVDLQPNNTEARISLGNLLLAGHQADKAAAQADAVLKLDSNNADAYALQAGVSAYKGDRPTAITQIQHALSIKPDSAPFHTTLGLLQATDPSTTAAGEDQLRKAVSLDSKDATAAIALASMLEKKGDLAGAQQQLQSAEAAAPKNVIVRSALADVYVRQNNTAQAEQTLRQAAEDLNDTDAGASLLANYYIKTNQLPRAESDYANLVSTHPKSIPLKLTYARILVLNHNIPKAKEVAAELAKTDSSMPEVAVLNGMLLLNDGKSTDAFNLLQKSAKANPDNFAVKLWLGRAALAKGDMNTAQQSFADAVRINSKSIEAQASLAGVAMQNKDYSTLADVAKNTMAAYPTSSTPYVWQGIAEANQKLFDKAEADFNQALKLNPKDWEAMLQLGQLRIIQHRVPEGQKYLEQSLSINPNNPRAIGLIVAAMLTQKQPNSAIIARIQQQIAKAPNSAEMYDLLGDIQLRSGDANGGLASAQKAMQLNPADASALATYSRAEITLGNTAQAADKWKQWLSTHPSDANAWTTLGSLQEAQGDRNGAMDSYKKALAIQPDQAIANNNVANIMVDTGQNLDVALSYAQAARRALPTSANTADTLAWVYYQKGNYESARDLLEDAAKADPNDAAIHYHLGMTYSKLSRNSDATTELKKAETLAPNSDAGKDAQKALSSIS